MIFGVLDYLALKYEGLRDIVLYMRQINVSGSGGGILREWKFDVLSSNQNKTTGVHRVEIANKVLLILDEIINLHQRSTIWTREKWGILKYMAVSIT